VYDCIIKPVFRTLNILDCRVSPSSTNNSRLESGSRNDLMLSMVSRRSARRSFLRSNAGEGPVFNLGLRRSLRGDVDGADEESGSCPTPDMLSLFALALFLLRLFLRVFAVKKEKEQRRREKGNDVVVLR